jgi:hypothetical protein
MKLEMTAPEGWERFFPFFLNVEGNSDNRNTPKISKSKSNIPTKTKQVKKNKIFKNKNRKCDKEARRLNSKSSSTVVDRLSKIPKSANIFCGIDEGRNTSSSCKNQS